MFRSDYMKSMIITGFEPFGGESMNPSREVVKSLPDTVGEYMLTKLCIPVVFGTAAEKVLQVADEIHPDVILSIGQAGGRAEVTPEMVAINLRHGKIPDNAGYQPMDEPVIEGGDAAYFSTLPVRKIEDAINDCGVSARVSYTMGTYVCNDLSYILLSHYAGSETRVGFIHVPYCTEQGKEPSMSLDDMTKAIVAAIKAI